MKNIKEELSKRGIDPGLHVVEPGPIKIDPGIVVTYHGRAYFQPTKRNDGGYDTHIHGGDIVILSKRLSPGLLNNLGTITAVYTRT